MNSKDVGKMITIRLSQKQLESLQERFLRFVDTTGERISRHKYLQRLLQVELV